MRSVRDVLPMDSCLARGVGQISLRVCLNSSILRSYDTVHCTERFPFEHWDSFVVDEQRPVGWTQQIIEWRAVSTVRKIFPQLPHAMSVENMDYNQSWFQPLLILRYLGTHSFFSIHISIVPFPLLVFIITVISLCTQSIINQKG